MEIIIAIVIVAIGAIWYFNRDKGLDVNKDGKIDLADAALAAQNTVEAVQEVVEEKVAEVKAKKPAKAKAKKAEVDFDAMKKDDLLAHAKSVGAKANASMKKADIIAAIKSVD